MQRGAFNLATVWVLASAVAASAGEVTLQLSTHQAYVGQRVTVRIQVAGAEDHEPPEFPDLKSATVRGPDIGQHSSISFVNGRMTRRTTATYTYTVVPRQPGTLRIPAIAVRVDGKTQATRPQTIRVSKSETGDLLFLQLASERGSVYFGESIEVDLEIWMKVYSDRNLKDGLEPKDMLSFIRAGESEWGRFKQSIGRIERRELRWQYRAGVRPDEDGLDQDYFVFVLPLTFVPASLGPLDVGEINVLISYPTGTRVGRNFFGRRNIEISGARPVQASLETSEIMVLAPPDQGRPAHFNGAVGRYRFDVRAHNTVARVREPIELTLTISGEGELDRVPAPPLADIEELTRDFRVPEERITGVVDQKRKRFVVNVRAKRAEVKEIPAIPFAYFDPIREQYVTLQSDPIPVRITASEQVPITQIGDAGGANGQAGTQLTETGVGIRANYADMDRVLAQQVVTPGWPTVAILAGSPLVFVVSALIQRRRLRLRWDQGYGRRRHARAKALAAIRTSAQQADRGQAASALASAVVAYISDRCNLPAGLTRAEAIEQLVGRGLAEERVRQVEELLLRCEDLQFAGGGGREVSDGLPDEAQRCIGQLERERF